MTHIAIFVFVLFLVGLEIESLEVNCLYLSYTYFFNFNASAVVKGNLNLFIYQFHCVNAFDYTLRNMP